LREVAADGDVEDYVPLLNADVFSPYTLSSQSQEISSTGTAETLTTEPTDQDIKLNEDASLLRWRLEMAEVVR
jgi:hypothetical protein